MKRFVPFFASLAVLICFSCVKPAELPPPDPEPEPASEPVPELSPAPEPALDRPADSASLADDFGLLVRHAGEVYEDLLHPPLPEEPETPAEDSAPGSAPQTPKGDWFSETEQLLSRLRRRVRSRGTPPN